MGNFGSRVRSAAGARWQVRRNNLTTRRACLLVFLIRTWGYLTAYIINVYGLGSRRIGAGHHPITTRHGRVSTCQEHQQHSALRALPCTICHSWNLPEFATFATGKTFIVRKTILVCMKISIRTIWLNHSQIWTLDLNSQTLAILYSIYKTTYRTERRCNWLLSNPYLFL